MRTKSQLFRLALLLAVLSLPVLADSAIPVDSESIDAMSWVSNASIQLVTGNGSAFLSIGSKWLTLAAVFSLFLVAIRYKFMHTNLTADLFRFLCVFLIAKSILVYYNSPLPWVGSNFHQLFTDEARYLSGFLDITNVNEVFKRIDGIVDGISRPSAWNPVELILYWIDIICLNLLSALLFLILAPGFIFTGVLIVLGPLFPWTLLFERTAKWFWNWLQLLLTYSFYPVVAAAFAGVFSNILLNAMDAVFSGSLALDHLFTLLSVLVVLLVTLGWIAFQVAHFTAGIFSGTAHTAHHYFAAGLAAARALF